MQLIPNVIGYHTNDKNRSIKFINNLSCIFSEDTHWLGYGMYFWDNLHNAVYWKTEKFRKHKKINEIWITKSNVLLDNILDLTDTTEAKNFELLWNDYANKKDYNTAQSNNIPIGEKIDRLFDFYDLKYLSIKCYGKYTKIRDLDLFNNTKGCKITQRVKVIYSIRDKCKIKNPVFVKEYKK